MTARVYRCTRCAAVATVYDGSRPHVSGCRQSTVGVHAWRLAL